MVYFVGFVMPFEKYPKADFLDGDTAKITFFGPETQEKRIMSIIDKVNRYLVGVPINKENVPNVVQYSSLKTLLDCDTPSGFPFVPKRMKDIIEELEPNVHQFFPLKVVDKNEEHIADRWLWNVCQRVDSVDKEHTTYLRKGNRSWQHNRYFSDDELPEGYDRNIKLKFVFSQKQIGSAHFWRDPHMVQKHLLYCSEEAGRALIAEGFSGLKFVKQETV